MSGIITATFLMEVFSHATSIEIWFVIYFSSVVFNLFFCFLLISLLSFSALEMVDFEKPVAFDMSIIVGFAILF